jgi:hypothetical protein
MPRAGSGWYYNLVHDLVVANGGQDARAIRERYRLQGYLTEVNCNISTLKPNRILPVLLPAMMGNKYVIKTHAGPSKLVQWLHRMGAIAILYIFRDPRAAMLSAFEYGRRASEKGRPNAFSHLTSLESAAEFIDFYVSIWQSWSEMDGILLVRYEDLVNDFIEEVERLSNLLDIQINSEDIRPVVEIYRPERGDAERKGTHYNKGQVERYREVFTSNQLKTFSAMFEPELSNMGYSE